MTLKSAGATKPAWGWQRKRWRRQPDQSVMGSLASGMKPFRGARLKRSVIPPLTLVAQAQVDRDFGSSASRPAGRAPDNGVSK